MKIFLSSLIIFTGVIINSCSEKGDEYYIQKEREQLKELLDEDKVLFYKTIKTMAKFSIAGKIGASLKYKSDFDKLETTHLGEVSENVSGQKDTLQTTSLINQVNSYYKAYQEFQKIKVFTQSVDEDSLPSFIELYASNPTPVSMKDTSIIDKELKTYIKNLEHILIGLTLYAPQQLPQSLSLYELDKIKMSDLGSNDIRGVTQCIKGFILSQYNFNYLSELEFTDNIKQLDDPLFATILLDPILPSQMQVSISKDERVRLELMNINLLGRALARVSMDKEIKKDLALKDCELFLENGEKLGWDNELIWVCGAYISLVKEDKDQALIYLKKLQSSSLSNDQEVQLIFTEAVKYLEERKAGDAYNVIHDKAFMAKLSFKLIVHGVERTGVFNKVYNAAGGKEFKEFKGRLEVESNSMMHLFTKDELMKKGNNVIKQAKGLVD